MQNNPDFFKLLLENDLTMSNPPTDVYPYFGSGANGAPIFVSVASSSSPTAAAIVDIPEYAIEPDYAIQEPDIRSYPARSSFGIGASSEGTNAGGSSGTDFRRRRNWPERILSEITGFLHVLSPVGKILHCSKSSLEVTGYTPEELIGKSLTDFLHVDDIAMFIRDFNRAFHTRSQIKLVYRFRKKDESYAILETIGHPRTDVPGRPPQSFFALAQPYPSRMGSLLDSFLELKMENEWLKQRLREVSGTETGALDSSFVDAIDIQGSRKLSHAAEAAGTATASTEMHANVLQAVSKDTTTDQQLWTSADDKSSASEFDVLMPLYGRNDLNMPTLPSAAGLTSSAHTGSSKAAEPREAGGQKWKRRVRISKKQNRDYYTYTQIVLFLYVSICRRIVG